MRSCGVAVLRPADRQFGQWRGLLAIAGRGDVTVINRNANPRAAANHVGIDRPALNQGGCPCVISVLLPTTSVATRISTFASRHCGRSSKMPKSTRRQYALSERAIALGWPAQQVYIIDQDLGMSGAHSVARDGFQELVAAVGLRKVGIVVGLEVSRLARNSVDWQQLLQLCAYTDTLILDEEGIYDPSAFNDRLLLGLKGTMSEAELHLLRSRLRGGILNKARRGELALRLPVGLVRLTDGRCARDPDAGIQASIAAVFQLFAATGTIADTVRQLLAGAIHFPQVIWGGQRAGTLTWCDYNRSRTINILTNPAYAGAYVYGRRRCRRAPDGHVESRKLKSEAWNVVIPDQFMGYISWSEFQAIQSQLHSNAQGRPKAFGPPREGPALLQGRVMCGRCGSQMYVRYNGIHGQRPRARYVCVDQTDARRAACQSVPAKDVDAAVAGLVLELMTPMAVEMTLAIQSELDRRLAESEQHYQLRITRVRYESDHHFARRRKALRPRPTA
jgi:DNA invertase Pin-like site-specific DNA recombinase